MMLIEVEETVIDVEEIAAVCKWESLSSSDGETDAKGYLKAFLVILKSGAVLGFRERASRQRILTVWNDSQGG